MVIGVCSNFYSRFKKVTAGKKFTEDLRKEIIQNPLSMGMAKLCAHYIAGIIQLSSAKRKAHWPQYPSNVIKGAERMNKIATFLGSILSIVTPILMFGGGIICLIICVGIVREVFGPAVSFLSLIIFPVLLAVAPWYALFAWGNWFPLVLTYGLGITITILFYISNWLTGEDFDQF